MQRYNLSKGSVLKILHEAGVVREQRHPSREQVDEMIKLYQQGWPLVKIGEHFGFNHGSVWLWLKERGLVMRNP